MGVSHELHGLPLGWTRQLSRIYRCCRAWIRSHHLPVNHHTKSTSSGVQEQNQSCFVFTMILSALTSHLSQVKTRQVTKIWVKPSSPTSSITMCPASLFVCAVVQRHLAVWVSSCDIALKLARRSPFLVVCVGFACGLSAAFCRWGESSSSSKCVCKNADVNQTHYQYFYMTADKKMMTNHFLEPRWKKLCRLGESQIDLWSTAAVTSCLRAWVISLFFSFFLSKCI